MCVDACVILVPSSLLPFLSLSLSLPPLQIINGVFLFAAGASAIGSGVYLEEEYATGDFYDIEDPSWSLERDWFFQMIAGILLVFSAISFLLIKFKRGANQLAADPQSASSSAPGTGNAVKMKSIAHSQTTMVRGMRIVLVALLFRSLSYAFQLACRCYCCAGCASRDRASTGIRRSLPPPLFPIGSVSVFAANVEQRLALVTT